MPPSNDNFADRLGISLGVPVPLTTFDATQESGEPDTGIAGAYPGGVLTQSVWCAFSLGSAATIRVAYELTSGSFDPVSLLIGTGSALGALTTIDPTASEGSGRNTVYTFDLPSGTFWLYVTTYYSDDPGVPDSYPSPFNISSQAFNLTMMEADQPALYAARAGSDPTSDLYTLDPLSGAATSLGAIGEAVTGLAVDPTDPTKLYFATSNNTAAFGGANRKSLGVIDLPTFPAEGSVTILGPLTNSGDEWVSMGDIAFDGAGQLYGFHRDSGAKVASIDKTNGFYVNIFGVLSGSFGMGLAIDSGNSCYAFPKGTNGHYYNFDLTGGGGFTDLGTLVPGTHVRVGDSIGAASFDASSLVWAFVGGQQLVVIDVVSMDVTLIADLSGTTWDALAWAPSASVSHTVTFDVNGGTGAMDPQVASTSTALSFNTFARVDFLFAGWNTAADGSGTAYADGATYPFSSDVTLYAQWRTPPPPEGLMSHPLLHTWRFWVTNLASVTITSLDALATGRSVRYELNAPSSSTGKVPAASPEVNILHTDGEPFLAEGVRLLYGFRRERRTTLLDPPWVIRFAGILLQIDDAVENDVPYSSYTAYDPWEYLKHRPVTNPDGSLPDVDGITFTATSAKAIAIALLTRSQTNSGPLFIDYGQTAFFAGDLNPTDPITINFQQGSSIGEAFTQLANTGTIDLVLRPIYDPVNRPGLIAELSTYVIAGSERPEAIFAWDKPSRSLTSIDRLEDGSQRTNKAEWIASDNTVAPPAADVTSIAKFKEYWSTQTIAAQTSLTVVEALAAEQVLMRKNHPTTIRIDIAPERSPVLFNEYYLGDTVPVYASKHLRKKLSGSQRIYAIPVLIDDNSTELVQQIEFSAETLIS